MENVWNHNSSLIGFIFFVICRWVSFCTCIMKAMHIINLSKCLASAQLEFKIWFKKKKHGQLDSYIHNLVSLAWPYINKYDIWAYSDEQFRFLIKNRHLYAYTLIIMLFTERRWLTIMLIGKQMGRNIIHFLFFLLIFKEERCHFLLQLEVVESSVTDVANFIFWNGKGWNKNLDIYYPLYSMWIVDRI